MTRRRDARRVAFGNPALVAEDVRAVWAWVRVELGVSTRLGRAITPADDGVETWARVAVIGHHLWQRAFGGDPAVINASLSLNGHRFSIVGVLPESFAGLDPGAAADVMVPMGGAVIASQTVNPLRNTGIWSPCRLIGRLKPGVTDAQAIDAGGP